jgi:hypothetical protein
MAIPTSKLDVINQALTEIGRPSVSNINDSEDSELLSVKFDLLLPILLEETEWNFAVVYREDSTPLIEPISPDFNNSFQLPPDYGRMFKFGNFYNNLNEPYFISNNLLSTNCNSIAYYYIINDVSVDAMPSLFIRALSLLIASDACLVLTENQSLTKDLRIKYEHERGRAVNRNDMERCIVSRPHNKYDRTAIV